MCVRYRDLRVGVVNRGIYKVRQFGQSTLEIDGLPMQATNLGTYLPTRVENENSHKNLCSEDFDVSKIK